MKTISTSLWTAPGIPGVSRWNEKKHVWWIKRVCGCGRVSKRTHLDTTSRQEWRSQHHLCITSRPWCYGRVVSAELTSADLLTRHTSQQMQPRLCPLVKNTSLDFFCILFSHYRDCRNTPLMDTGKLQTQQLRLFRDVKCVFKVKQTWVCTGKHSFPSFLLSRCEIDYRISEKGPVNSLRWFPIKRHSGSYTAHLSRTAPSLPRCHVIPRKKSWEEKDEWVLSHSW